MIVAISLLILGYTIRMMAITANKGFSLSVKKPDILCTTGIYKYVRHPAYVGSILMLTGLYIVSPILAFTYLVFVLFFIRALSEEQILEFTFKEYKDYKKKTGMFLPKIRRKVCK
jgi:protein-S-isoprenylcysteine O-methyltransferase Ste14